MDALVREKATGLVSWSEKVLFFFLIILAFTLPFDGYNLFGLGSIFRLFSLIVLSALLFFVIMSQKIYRKFTNNLFSVTSISLLLFIGWSGVTISWAPNAEWALSRAFSYLGLLGVTFSISVLPPAMIAQLWLIMLLGVITSLPLGFILPHPNPLLVESGRFSSGGKDPNDYSNLALIAFLVAYFGSLAYLPRTSRRAVSWLCWLVLLAVPLSASRTALLNTLFNLGLGLFGRGLRGIFLMATIFVASFTGFFLFSESDLVSIFAERATTIANIQDESTWAGRMDIWRAAWHVFTLHPLGGVGVANFAWISPQYSGTAALIASFREDGGGGVAHNSFLSVLAETGIVGFAFFASLQFALFFWLLRKRHQYPLAKGLLLGLLAYWVASLTLTWEYVKIPFFLYGSALALKGGEDR